MYRNSATVRYYFLVGVYSLSVGLLLLSAFLGIKYFNLTSLGWGHEYLAWIISFGAIGLLLLIGALIVGAQWKRANLVEPPDMSEEQYKLFIISIGNGIVLIASQLTGMLTVGFSAGTFSICLLVPLTFLLWLFSLARYIFKFKGAALSLLVNSMFIVLVVLLQWTNNTLDFGFRWRLNGYEEVVSLVENGEIQADRNGFATLPADYQWLSDSGDIMIVERENIMSVIFFTQLEFPGEYYGIAYRSDDSVPTNYHDDRCDRGWRIQDDIPNWFVCISTRVDPD